MYTVIINDKYSEESDDELYNYLTFDFDNLDKAIEFSKNILKISKYTIEIIPFVKGE